MTLMHLHLIYCSHPMSACWTAPLNDAPATTFKILRRPTRASEVSAVALVELLTVRTVGEPYNKGAGVGDHRSGPMM
jgi:hypothetical protein